MEHKLKSYDELIRVLFIILLISSMVVTVTPVFAGTLSVRSADVAPGDTITIPLELTGDVQDIYGLQMDLGTAP